MQLRLLNTAATMGLLALFVVILVEARSLLLPFIVALVFWYIIISLSTFYQGLSCKGYRLAHGVAFSLAVVTAGLFLYAFFYFLGQSITSIVKESPQYQAKLVSLLNYVSELLDKKLSVNKIISNINISHFFTNIASLLTTVASNVTLIFIYLLFLLLEHKTFNVKLKAMCNGEERYQRVKSILNNIDSDINKYLKLKTVFNLLAGVLSYIVLLTFKVNYSEFWGMLIFLLNYIPFIGPIVAVLFVLIAISIQITTLWVFGLLAIILAVIQFVVGNILEPKYMGTHLNLSPVVILLSLAFWGALWGIIGMILCIPLMVIINIVLAKFPSTRPVAVLLSAEGCVD